MPLSPRDNALRARAYRRANPEKIRESSRSRREQKAATRKRYRENHPEKARALSLLHYRVAKGLIVRPSICSECGGSPAPGMYIDAHHSDYSKPYDVDWLCRSCHGKRHRKYKETAA